MTIAVGMLVILAVVEVSVGLWMVLQTPPIAEKVGFTLYGAGAPVSAAFAALAGELPLAPFTDVIVWLIAGSVAARVSERRAIPVWRVVAMIAIIALVYGASIATTIERIQA